MKAYIILAYYNFCKVADPQEEVAAHHAFFLGKDVTCRIYISEQGINGQMCAAQEDAIAYIQWLHNHPEFAHTHFKQQEHHEHIYPRTTVKYRKYLVGMDEEVNLNQRGEYLAPEKWKEMLESSSSRILLDVRNDYEWKIGHFEGAEAPPCETFRDFSEYADRLKQTTDATSTPVLMYCTGGIRCELFSAMLKAKGFDKVYQLEGGIINYGLQQGSKHWQGKLFVFDDRLAIPLKEGEESSPIATCHHCGNPNDTYYNCANMDCNTLFLCCSVCLPQFQGCCQTACAEGDRVRPYQKGNSKPFRKWYHYPSKTACSIGGDSK
jgi:UPF0176 protein